MTLTDTTLAEIEAAARAATEGNLDTVPNPSNEYGGKEDDGYYECPFCHGEGSVDGITYTNFDRVAIGVQFFGIGDEPKQYENYFRAIPPAVAAAMAGEIRALRSMLALVPPEYMKALLYIQETAPLMKGTSDV